jgi:hypothetical protein
MRKLRKLNNSNVLFCMKQKEDFVVSEINV